jgi:flagellar hook-associated protein FlgK
MNIEKLYKIAFIIVDDITRNKIPQLFDSFFSSLTQIVSNPQHVPYQDAFVTARDNLFEALEVCHTNDLGAI